MSFSIELLPALADNYIYLVSDIELGLAMVVDPGDADIVLKALEKKDLHLALILNTHHHSDHIGGNAKLQRKYGAPIIGPSKESHRIEGLARGVEENDAVTFSDLRGQVIETPGHTSGHVSYYFPQLKALFCGDTLFPMSCGRLFEGTSAALWASLVKLRNLPEETLVYCGHERTEKNVQFALKLDKNNEALKQRAQVVADLKCQGKTIIPTTIGSEKQTNPFLRIDDPAFQKVLLKSGLPATDTDPAAIFGALRSAKDHFT